VIKTAHTCANKFVQWRQLNRATGGKKGAFYLLRGLPRGLRVDSRPRRLAVSFIQRSLPYGVPRDSVTKRRNRRFALRMSDERRPVSRQRHGPRMNQLRCLTSRPLPEARPLPFAFGGGHFHARRVRMVAWEAAAKHARNKKSGPQSATMIPLGCISRAGLRALGSQRFMRCLATS
jgi:hypothetical protein